MSNMISVKTNFTSGQVSENLFGRGDLKIFENGASCLENVLIQPTGGVSRRYGTRFVEELSKPAKLIPFEFNTEQIYLICIMDSEVKVYKNDECIADLEAPWKEEHLHNLNWTQSADTLLIVTPDVPPQQISRNNGEVWEIGEWKFYTADGFVYCPYYNFFKYKEKINTTGSSGTINITAANDIFDENYVGSLIKINGGLVEVSEYVNAKTLKGVVQKTLTSVKETDDWEESSFSKRRGYPSSVTFHQDRMVIGGSKSLPNRLWLSKSSDLFNFDLGEGKDDEAIEFAILSDQVNAIKAVVSSRHLQVFTTGAEWMVSGDPLTPSSIQLHRQTSIGIYSGKNLPPQPIGGATVFISSNGKQLREFLYTDLEQAYQAKDLTLMSSDMLSFPTDIVFNPDEAVLYILQEDGTASCLTSYRSEEVNAWSRIKTNGHFLFMTVIGADVYVCTLRNGRYFLEKFDKETYSDCTLFLSSETPKKEWSELDVLEGNEVTVIADGFSVGKQVVTGGGIVLLDAAKEIIVGIPYLHVIEPLPFMVDAVRPYAPSALRIVWGMFRLINTRAFCIDIGCGYFQVPLKRVHRDVILDSPPSYYSGDVCLRSLGWKREMKKPLWSIKSDEPLAFTLLSAALEIKVKG